MNHTVCKPLLILGLAGLAAGLYGFGEAIWLRTHATNLTSYVPWGMGVALYLLFVGFSAGGLLISALTQIFGVKELKRIGGLATYAALVAEICAAIAIGLDLGHMERLPNFILSPSFSSPMFWMFVFFTGVLVVSLLKAWAFARLDDAVVSLWSWISIPVGLAFYFTNGYFFSIITSHGLWSGPLIPVLFVTAALLCGGALVLALAWWSSTDKDSVRILARVVFWLLAFFIVLETLWLWSGWQSGRVDLLAATANLLMGKSWWTFWVLHAGLGLVVPLLLLPQAKDNPGAAAWAGLLILLGFIGARWAFVVAAQSVAMLPGLDLAWQHPRLSLTYLPGLGEWLVAVGVCSVALLGFVTGPRLFPRLYGSGPHSTPAPSAR